jgi:hypothetical protein
MENTFITSDINLTAYLISQGFKVVSTHTNGKFVEFEFEKQTVEEGRQWQFEPTNEMRLIQGFLLEKDKLLTYLKTNGAR